MAVFFEFTDSGIKFVGFQDVRAALKDDWIRIFGESIDLTPTSPDGHHVDLESKAINAMNEGLQVITSCLNRRQATGQFLDMLAAFIPLDRNEGETDEQFRERMDNANVDGLCTVAGMDTYLQDKVGNDISIAFNDDGIVVDGIEPHGFRVSVPLSNPTADNDIAQAIFECKPAGIKSCGNVDATASYNGRSYNVRFSRPVDVSIDIKVIVHKYSEEAFPVDGEESIKNDIIAWATGKDPFGVAEYKAGKDVIPSRLFVPIFRTPGIKYPEISVCRTGESWTSDVISISSEETAVINDITVEVYGG
ncbi:MAG: hypothetical protein HUK20_06095 [Fibrobacter sp.]|nr:hypothetical protein [Fibrobacter sp.]